MDDDADVAVVEPVLVQLAPTEPPEKTAGADLASFRTFTLLGTEAPFLLLGQDRKRHRALVTAHNPLGAAAPAIPPFVFVGRRNQIAASGDARGAALVAGDGPYETHAATEIWLIPTGSAISVSVIEERNL